MAPSNLKRNLSKHDVFQGRGDDDNDRMEEATSEVSFSPLDQSSEHGSMSSERSSRLIPPSSSLSIDGPAESAPVDGARSGAAVREDRWSDDGHSKPCAKKKRDWRRICCRAFITITMVSSVSFVIIDLVFLKQYLRPWLEAFLEWMQDHPFAGVFAFLGIFLVASLVFFPPSLLMLGSGFVYMEAFGLEVGVAAATFVCFLGACIGAVVAFLRSRYMMRGLIKRFAKRYPIIKAVDTAFKTQGFRIFLLLRLSPAVPFNALNYIGGITGVTMSDYIMSLVGILPGTVVLVFIGATAGTISEGLEGKNAAATISSLVVGIVLAILSIALTTAYAKRNLAKIIQQQEQEAAEAAEGNADLEANGGVDGEQSTTAHRDIMAQRGLDHRICPEEIDIEGYSAQTIHSRDTDAAKSNGAEPDVEWFWVWA